MINRVAGLFALLLCLAGSSTVWAEVMQPEPPSSAQAGAGREVSVERLTTLLAPFERFEAQFTQFTLDGSGRLLDQAAGRMAIFRPGRFRWDYTQPDQQLILADGNNLWIYYIEN